MAFPSSSVRDGDGVEQDGVEAARLYRLAAEEGCSFGRVSLGMCYLLCRGVEKNAEEAVEHFRLAVESWCHQGQLELGRCLKYGNGVPKMKKKLCVCFGSRRILATLTPTLS